MTPVITTDLVEAYAHCPRKGYLLMTGAPNPGPHEYLKIVGELAAATRHAHLCRIGTVRHLPYTGPADLRADTEILTGADLLADGLKTHCDFLTKATGPTGLGHGYEPGMAIGTRRVGRIDAIGLAYRGLVLGQVQGRLPAAGTVVRLGGRPCRVKLSAKYKEVRRIVEALRAVARAPDDGAAVVLNKHCPCCPFRDTCRPQAEKADDLSLLDRMTPRSMRQYHDKGIFTVKQLSHLYRPRRRKAGRRPARHSLELQALAIRTGKAYIESLPDPPRGPVELVLDLEGVPEFDAYYLAGLLVCRDGVTEYQSFWADDEPGEAAMWSDLVARLDEFPDAPIYHYGSYEGKAFATLARRHGMGAHLRPRLVNLASFVYGKVYFPVRSNGLKAVGRFLGAAWSDPQASGLQSLVWRHRWMTTRDERHKEALLRYNREDCAAVRVLLDRLGRLKRDATEDPGVEFARRPKRYATEAGGEAHRQFERILESAHEDFGGGGIRIRDRDPGPTVEPRKRGGRLGHVVYRRVLPSKVNRVVRVPPKRRCSKGHGALEYNELEPAARTVIDLVFSRNGCRKTVTRYEGRKGYCPKCHRTFNPPLLGRLHNRDFGHSFQAWTVYQRVVLRLPYRIIAQVTEHLFGVGLSDSSGVNFLRYLSDYYAPTEAASLRAIRASAFVHVDETRINVQGVDHYAWVFTDGRHVVFRMTETRAADVVREVLDGFEGVLVTDFYPGYDSMPCRQQKCLVHLIRDINDDLWKAPFDREFEAFALALQSLLVPILGAVDWYGLKARHLRKYGRSVDRFYAQHVTGREYKSELAAAYQKRFARYRGSLFMFLERDGVPWNNNMAERALRHLAIQRKISGSFFKRSAGHYLRLLAVAQTCRFQGKSFLKFLLSTETDVDVFRSAKAIRYSLPMNSPGATDETGSTGGPESG
jgi:predicted RecB family nuclease